jgi:hypothetical protein
VGCLPRAAEFAVLPAAELGTMSLGTVALGTVGLDPMALRAEQAALRIFRGLQVTHFDVCFVFHDWFFCCFGLLLVSVMSLAPNNN